MSPGGHYQDGRGWGLGHQLTREASLQVAQGRRGEPHCSTKGWLGRALSLWSPMSSLPPWHSCGCSPMLCRPVLLMFPELFHWQRQHPEPAFGMPSIIPPHAGLGFSAGVWGWRLGQGMPLLLGPGALQECANCCWNKSCFCAVLCTAVLILPRPRANAPSGFCCVLCRHS